MSHQPDAPTWRRALVLANTAPRCRARRKSDKQCCRGPAVKERPTCRMHGGTGGAPKGKRNGAYRHGRYTLDALAERRQARATTRRIRELVAYLGALATNGE
jgi:hypothetical protein